MIEIIRERPDARPSTAVLDFDGTLSLVRSGWQGVMQHLMLDALLPVADDATPEALRGRVAAAIDALTGHPTSHQMAWLCAELARLGAHPGDPEEHKRRYLALLDEHVSRRLDGLAAGLVARDDLLVPGSRALLERLRARGALLVLASGTDLPDVLRESEALGILPFFGPRVYGPGPHAPGFTKRAVLERLLADGVAGHQIVAVGDGPVEIGEARAVGGLALGVAFDEAAGGGLDPHKRERLVAAGADAIVEDLADAAAYLERLGAA